MRIKNLIKRVLGISELEKENLELRLKLDKIESKFQSKMEVITDKHINLERTCHDISCDNSTILKHVNFLNSEFSVVSDISSSRYDPSIVLIMRRGQQEIVRTYEFNSGTVEEIYSILEGFGKDNNRIDKPRNFPGPKFRY